MAQAITNKPVKLEQTKLISKDYNEKINKKVDAVEGKSLVDDDEITKLSGIEAGAQKNNITSVEVNGTPQVIGEDGKLSLDVEAVLDTDGFVKDQDLTEQLAPYLKSEDANGKFATKEEMTNLGTIQGTCEKEELESKKEGASVGDCFVVTDDSNHIYFYNGTDFVDTGNDIDLTPYLKSAEAETTYVKKTDAENYLTEDNIVFASDEEVTAQLLAGYTEALGAGA